MSNVIDDPRKGATSASNALADSLCPGRFLAQRGIPEPPRSADASMGTRIHQALATELEPAKLTLEEREVFDACREIEKKTVSQMFGEEKLAVFRHKRAWCNVPKINEPGTFLFHSGEADVVYRGGSRILVIDYKTLAGDVPDSPRNLQLRDLAVLFRGAFVTITEAATLIVQPFVTHTPEVCVYNTPDLDRAQGDMFARVAASNDPGSQRIAGEAQCQFCLAKTRCATYQKWAGQMTPPALLNVLEIPMASWTVEQRLTAASAMKPAMDLLEEMKEWFKTNVAKDPNFLPGWFLQPGNKRETITNPDKCFERFAAIGGTMKQFMACISVGKTKLKEQTNVVTGAKGKALDAAIGTLTEGIVEVSQNAPSLKRKEPK